MNSIPCTSGIYAIICILTGKCYIGSAVDLRERQSQHFSEMKRGIHFNEHLQRAVIKYGIENFSFKIIEYCERDMLQEREQYYLDWLQPFNERGFNIVPIVSAAMKGRKHKPETIQKIKTALKGRKLSTGMTGHTHSIETRKKLSINKTAQWDKISPNRPHRRKAGDPIRPSVKRMEHSRELGLSWKNKKRDPISVEQSAEARRKYYIVTNPEGIEMKIKGLNKFCEQYGLNRSNMLAVASGKVKTHHGWKCRKVEK